LTVVFACAVSLHVRVPVQPPRDQPENDERALAAADSCTTVPFATDSVQPVFVASLTQSIPAGVLFSVPAPVPVGVTVRRWLDEVEGGPASATSIGQFEFSYAIAPGSRPGRLWPRSATARGPRSWSRRVRVCRTRPQVPTRRSR